MSKKIYLTIISVLIIMTGAALLTLYKLTPQKITFTSPAGQPQPIPTQINSQYTIIGFLPYWNLKYTDSIKSHLLTHIAYFGISITEKGQIETELNDGTKELGHHRLRNEELIQAISKIETSGGKPILVIRAMSNERIKAATDPENQDQLIQEILTIVKQAGYKGINIDFEPNQATDKTLTTQTTNFVKKISTTCKQQLSECHISIDIFSSTASNPRIWDLPKISESVDHIIVMGYDFVQTSSPQTGPHAPMYGSPYRWKYDIHTTMTQLYSIVPSTKIILSVPYYGYEWTSKSPQPGATTISQTGKLATYARVQTLTKNCQSPECTRQWDSDALTPFIIINNNNNTWQQIWYEDSRSLNYKYQLIKQYQLAGAAIWALGYDTPFEDLWITLEENFTTPGQ